MQQREPHVDFDLLFGEDYEYFEIPFLPHELNATEVSQMIRLASLSPGMRILDAPCGHGRHANELAARCYDVVGADRDERFLSRARRSASDLGVKVDYRNLDLREMNFQAEFDAAFSWYSSFGYFDDATDRDILRRYRLALRPGGRFLLDMASPYRLVPSMAGNRGTSTYVRRRGADIALDIIELDAAASRHYAERITIRGGRHQRYRYCVRMFTAPEIIEWFTTAGFAEAKVMDENGDPFTVLSRRLTVLGTA